MPLRRLAPAAVTALGTLCLCASVSLVRAEPVQRLTLDDAQAKALGVSSQAPVSGQPLRRAFPARVTLPSRQQRVVAAPFEGLVAELRVDEAGAFRRGDVLAVLRSRAAGELTRELRIAQSQAQLAADGLRRDETLFAEGLIPRARLDAARATARQAELLRDERQAALTPAGAGAPGADGTLVLRAPFDGVVIERMATVGERADVTTPLLRIARLDRAWLAMQVPVADVAGLQVGDAVEVQGLKDAHATAPTPPTARVVAIAHALDEATQTVMVRAEMPWHAGLRVGQAVVVQHLQPSPQGLQVPDRALSFDGGKAHVFVDEGQGRYRAQPVQVLSRAGQAVVVRGVPAGSRVVVQGVAALKSALAGAQG